MPIASPCESWDRSWLPCRQSLGFRLLTGENSIAHVMYPACEAHTLCNSWYLPHPIGTLVPGTGGGSQSCTSRYETMYGMDTRGLSRSADRLGYAFPSKSQIANRKLQIAVRSSAHLSRLFST